MRIEGLFTVIDVTVRKLFILFIRNHSRDGIKERK